MLQKLCLLAVFGLWTSVVRAAETPPSPRLLVHLLDYLAKDYAGAVGPQHQVLSASEFAEQLEFSQTARTTGHQLPELAKEPELLAGIDRLASLIAAKGEPVEVEALAHHLQESIVQLAHLEVGPQVQPDAANGARLYQQNCAVCHGASGRGDGPGGTALKPPPANFLSPQRMQGVAPFHAFNTIRLGIPGTAMPGFAQLNDHEVWDLAYYVLALLPGRVLPSWQQNHNQATQAPDAVDGVLAHARQLLKAAQTAYAGGDHAGAKTLALQAYLEGIEPIEPRLKASNPEAAQVTEGKMAAVRAAIEANTPDAEVSAAVDLATQQIEALQPLLQHNSLAPGVAFVATSSILLREGFEAVLLIMALLGVIRASGSRRAAWWVHAGWVSALGSGFAAWCASGYLLQISGAQREMMEAVTSLLAVGVLLLVGFWLHSRTEIGRWNRFLRVKVRAAVTSRSFFGLALIAFFAVFREAIETVLFLRTIWIDSSEPARSALGLSVLLTVGLIILASWALLRFSTKIPVRKLFAVSAVVMATLAVILTGKGLHSLQETGALPVTTPGVPVHFELFGLFPTYETLVPQVLVVALIIGLWIYGRRPSGGERRPVRGSVV